MVVGADESTSPDEHEAIAKTCREALKLKAVAAGEHFIYYDEAFAEQAKTMAAKLPELRKQFAQMRQVVHEQRDAILAELNRIVGGERTEKQLAEQQRFLTFFTDMTYPLLAPGDVYLVPKERMKAYLQQGGRFPFTRYDEADDRVTYEFHFDEDRLAELAGRFPPFLVAARNADDVEQFDVLGAQASLGDAHVVRCGLAFHEVAEFAMMVHRLNARHLFARWFSDGFANVLAAHLLAKFIGENTGEVFLKHFDHTEYEDLRRYVQLRYWPGATYDAELPFKREHRLGDARYAYATFEAQKFVNEHGVDAITTLLDAAATKEKDHGLYLAAAMRVHFGVDTNAMFQRYESFASTAEGIQRFERELKEAAEAKKYEDAIWALRRLMEIQLGNGDFPSKAQWLYPAYALQDMSRPHDANAYFDSLLHTARQSNFEAFHLTVLEQLVIYAINFGRIERAYDAAERVLEVEPRSYGCFYVRMHRLIGEEKLDEARRAARRLIELEPKWSKDRQRIDHLIETGQWKDEPDAPPP